MGVTGYTLRTNVGPRLIHVEIALQDTLLESIRHSGSLGHLLGRRLHHGHALGSVMHRRRRTRAEAGSARDGGPLGSSTEVLGKVVALT